MGSGFCGYISLCKHYEINLMNIINKIVLSPTSNRYLYTFVMKCCLLPLDKTSIELRLWLDT